MNSEPSLIDPSYRTVELKRKDLYQSHATDLKEFSCDTRFDHQSRRIVEILRASVYGEPVESVRSKHPKDWREAFKERWFSKWMLKKWPVQYNHYESVSYIMYPNFEPSIPNQRFYHLTEYGPVDASR